MKKLLLALTLSFTLNADVGWVGNALEVDSVGKIVKVVDIATDLQLVGVKKQSALKLTGNAACSVASDCTVQLTVGEIRGQTLTIFKTNTNPIEILDGQAIPTAGEIKLDGDVDWTPGPFDTLKLFYTGNNWVEISRSNN